MKKNKLGVSAKKRIVFPRRIPEPKIMEKIELDTFEKLSLQNYKRWFIPLADNALAEADLTKGQILDVGCGPGLLTKELAQRSKKFQVVGIDIAPYAIRLARKNCKGLTNVTFRLGNVYNLPFLDHSFDLVVCKDSLHHFNNVGRAVKEMYRVTKNGGLLYLQDLRRDLPQYLLQRSIPPNTILKKLQFYSARASYTKKELKKIFKDLGFEGYEVRTRKLTNITRQRYRKKGIDIQQLKESFQARYIATLKP